MSKKQKFIELVEELMSAAKFNPETTGNEYYPEAMVYWNALKTEEEKDKPMFTENGLAIFKYMRENSHIENFKSREIAEGMFISARSVSGAIRKLVTDGFVEKNGKDPIIYSLTQKGKDFIFEN